MKKEFFLRIKEAVMNGEKFKRIMLSLVIFFVICTTCFSERADYNKILNLSVKSDKIIVKHYHDWAKAGEKHIIMSIRHLDHFNDFGINDYAYLKCIDRKSGKQLFKKSTNALTKIFIDKDSRYIIGLSKIKIINPYQIVVFTINGDLILKKHIAVFEAKLTSFEYQNFKKKYPKENIILESLDRITNKAGYIYVDFLSMNMPIRLGKAWDYLFKLKIESHLSRNFSETVGNWIFWYKEPDPEIELKYNQCQQLIAISLLDPKGERFEIPIKPGKKY